MKILILGAGGIGGYFGGRLVESGADVTFLVRQKRAVQLARDGLVIESPVGNAKIEVKTVTAETLEPGYDLVLFTCKAYDLNSAMEAIAPAMVGSCAVLPMLNGLSHFEKLDARFGAPNVIGGTCMINVTLLSNGVVRHMEPLNRIVFGERDGKESPRTKAFGEVLAKSTIDFTHSKDILQDLWEKLMFLSCLAATTCLFRANVGEIMATPEGQKLVERCFDANVAIATKEGKPPRPKALEAYRARLTDPAGKGAASMQRDLEAGKPVESDHIVGFMLERARRHGIDDTVLAIAYTHLKAYEVRRAAGRLPEP
ncbi:2-dehydropantoate 2-reductase [Betaproteobacteria bacterium GR16-43]|nr:2-dehydropantoate 2-reductase [Betaproteobacteria bacterium GR16-43]